jgi:hypothetical protein
MRHPLTHDIRSWVTPEEYIGAVHAAECSDRTLSGYVRHLIRTDLALRASSMARHEARDELSGDRAGEGRK